MQGANPSYFIEQVKYYDGEVRSMSKLPINQLKWSLGVTERRGLYATTIAVFKIYPKVKPVIAQWDYDLKTTIVE